jgi:PhnB protein
MTTDMTTDQHGAADTSAPNSPSVNGVPAGYTTITPFLVVDGAARAIEFYATAFGATEVSRNDGPDGTIAHCELDFGTGRLQLSDPIPAMGLVPPDGTGQVNHSYVLYCADVDATFAAAVAAGGSAVEKPSTFVTGDRFGAVMDPFGHRWAILTRVEDVPPEEAQRRVDEWLASQK